MKGTWWVSEDSLDSKQKDVIKIPIDDSFLVLGSPGSGKTNLLLLRAKFLYLSGLKNILIICFTRSLRDFIAAGSVGYDFPDDKVVTSIGWAGDFLRQHGVRIPEGEGFAEKRKNLFEALGDLVKDQNITHLYDAIFVDEAQDYLPDELELLRGLSPRLCVTADKKQKIYPSKSDVVELLEQMVDSKVELQHHYRNGREICRVADGLGSKWTNYEPMVNGCNYDEVSKPSSVEVVQCADINIQAQELVKRLNIQLKAYPDELIGVITPRLNELNIIWDHIVSAGMESISILQRADTHHIFNEHAKICFTTMHSSKGLEFRALHMLSCEHLKKFENQRQLAYTATTRCKTSLIYYHSENLPGYLESALQVLEPVPDVPEISDLFGGAK